MTVIKSKLEELNAKDTKTIEVAFNCGGYFSQLGMNTLFSDISNQSNWERLKKIVDLGYLKEHLLDSNSPNEPVTYQVTGGACKMMNNPDSYFRKKHNKSYIKRSLIKGLFIVENFVETYDSIIFNGKDKEQFLLEKGYSEKSFPTKKNYNIHTQVFDDIMQVEEMIIDTSKMAVRPKCLSNMDVDIVFIYIDKEHPSSITGQIKILLENYRKIVEEDKARVGFLFVADNKKRAELYKKIAEIEISKIFEFKDKSISDNTRSIDDSLLKTYVGVQKRYLEIKGNYEQIPKLIEALERGETKKKIESDLAQKKLEKLEVHQQERISLYNNKAIDLIQNYVREMLNKEGEAGFKTVIGFLKDIILLNYNNNINFSSDEKKAAQSNSEKYLPISTYCVRKSYYTFLDK